MYLQVAEKYRLQNLSPDLFERYLPYAIIFNVEKQWAKAFRSVSMAIPSWYSSSGAPATYFFLSSKGRGFSPEVFSASFSSSIRSAFSIPSGSGVGGGSAGGGGGGGGGGAS